MLYEEISRQENGVKTKVNILADLIHGFWGMFPNAEFSKELKKKGELDLGCLFDHLKKDNEAELSWLGSHSSRTNPEHERK